MHAAIQSPNFTSNANGVACDDLVVPLSDAQRYLVNKLPANGEWMRVPAAVRSSTIRSLINRGVIDHKKNIAEYWDEWLSMGWVRLRHNHGEGPI